MFPTFSLAACSADYINCNSSYLEAVILNAVVAITAMESVTSIIKAFIDDLILTAQKFERL